MKSALIVIAAVLAASFGPRAFASPSDPSAAAVETPPLASEPLTSLPTGPIHMTVAGEDMTAAAPEGYCDPIGQLSVLKAAMTTWAERADLDLGAVWVKCDFHVGQSGPIELALVAAKADGPKFPYSRKVMIKSVVEALPTPEGRALIAQGMAKGVAAEDDSTATTKLEGQPQVVGVDDDAVYLLVDADRTSQSGQMPFSVVEGLTLIKGRIAVFAFAVVQGSAQDKAALVADAKLGVKRFIAMNGG